MWTWILEIMFEWLSPLLVSLLCNSVIYFDLSLVRFFSFIGSSLILCVVYAPTIKSFEDFFYYFSSLPQFIPIEVDAFPMEVGRSLMTLGRFQLSIILSSYSTFPIDVGTYSIEVKELCVDVVGRRFLSVVLFLSFLSKGLVRG